MLVFLSMKNFALIEELSFDLHPGLNVLTGETGAGKSIVVGAISLLLGERASSEQIRSGYDKALIEAAFTWSGVQPALAAKLGEIGVDPAENLIVSREISSSGRNVCRVNARMVPLSTLKEIGRFLVDLHGQHSHQSLLFAEQQLLLLDEFGGENVLTERRHWQSLYQKRQKIQQMLRELGENPRERARRLELLSYQQDEIEAAALDPQEEERLQQKLALLDNQEKLLAAVHRAYHELYQGEPETIPVLDRIIRIKDELLALSRFDPEFQGYAAILEEASAGLTELSHELFRYQDRLAFSPEERQETEDRLETYRNLKRKYGQTVQEVLAFQERCQKEIEDLENSEARATELEKERQTIEEQMEHCGVALFEKRKAAAETVESLMIELLQELGMSGGKFQVSFRQKEKPDRLGKEDVEFLFSANPGEAPKPLSKIISAGEMARVMLALKSILAEQDQIPTLIFDEIDSGIGGKTIQRVAEKLADLSAYHQVICVTHSPHIAGKAHHQYNIYKEPSGSRTVTRLKYLDTDMRIHEIARMLGGEESSEITKRHAEKLLEKEQERA